MRGQSLQATKILFYLLALPAVFLFFNPTKSFASSGIIVNKLSTGLSVGGKSPEFVELFNTTNQDILIYRKGDTEAGEKDILNLKLEFVNLETGRSSNKTLTPFLQTEEIILPSFGYLLLASTSLVDEVEADLTFSASLPEDKDYAIKITDLRLNELADEVCLSAVEGGCAAQRLSDSTFLERNFCSLVPLPVIQSQEYQVNNREEITLHNSLSPPRDLLSGQFSTLPRVEPLQGDENQAFRFEIAYNYCVDAVDPMIKLMLINAQGKATSFFLQDASLERDPEEGKIFFWQGKVSPGNYNYFFQAENNGVIVESDFFEGLSVRQANHPPKILHFSTPANISGQKILTWKVEDKEAVTNRLFISQNLIDWEKLYEGQNEYYSFNSKEYPNGIYYFLIEVADSGSPSLKAEKKSSASKINNLYPGDGEIIISEVESNDADGLEWIELFNITQKSFFSTDLVIEDNNSKDILTVNLLAHQYIVIVNDQVKFKRKYGSIPNTYQVLDGKLGNGLSNQGDLIRLRNKWGELLDKVQISAYEKQSSYNLFDKVWHWSLNITPGKENILLSEVPVEETEEDGEDEYQSLDILNISQAKSSGEDRYVFLEGYVNTEPGILGKQIFYIQDESGGLEVYQYAANFPILSTGQLVRVYGRINSILNRIIVSQKEDIVPLDYIQDLTPAVLSDGGPENQLGQLVFVEGVVKSKDGSTVFLENLSTPVYFKAGIKRPPIRVSDRVKIIGVLDKERDGIRLLPRFIEDSQIRATRQPQVKKKIINSLKQKIIPKAQAQGKVEQSMAEEQKNTPEVALLKGKNLIEKRATSSEKKFSLFWYYVVLVSGVFSLSSLYYYLRSKYQGKV